MSGRICLSVRSQCRRGGFVATSPNSRKAYPPARAFGWLWMDPLAGIIGACVIASWSYGLICDTGAILLDMNPDRSMASKLRQAVEGDGDQLADLAPLALGAGREADYYKNRLACFTSLSHLTVEVTHQS